MIPRTGENVSANSDVVLMDSYALSDNDDNNNAVSVHGEDDDTVSNNSDVVLMDEKAASGYKEDGMLEFEGRVGEEGDDEEKVVLLNPQAEAKMMRTRAAYV